MPPKTVKKRFPLPLGTSTGGNSQARRVRVRTYRHGLGDCHLISFTKPDGTLFNILIDCGVVDVTPNPVPLMTGVVRDVAGQIRRAGVPKDTLDLLIATHQHTDHLSGFAQAQGEFDDLNIKRLWLAWTEDKTNPLGKKVKQQLVNALAAVRAAHARLAPLDAEAAGRIKGLLDFFGPVGVTGDKTQAILDYLQARKDAEISYHNPGTVFLLPEVPNVRVYVLGPPTDPEKTEDHQSAEKQTPRGMRRPAWRPMRMDLWMRFCRN